MDMSDALPAGSFVVTRRGETKVLYTPLPHQAAFHASTTRFTLMEGGRGSGKSMAMRWEAYGYCMAIPRFRALIVRRSMPELKSSHLQHVPFEVEQMGLPKEAWHATDFKVRFPNGSELRFGHVENDEAVVKYLSSEIEALYLDELATFSLRQFTFLCTSLRSTIPGFKPFVRAATNPVGPGSGWVKMLFIDKNPPLDEFRYYNPADYTTIHSVMDDNPYIDRIAYDVMLSSIPSDALRRALRHGEWTIEGQMFSEWREALDDGTPWHVIDQPPRIRGEVAWRVPHMEVVRAIDWGYSATGNPGICLWFVCLPDDTAVCFQEWLFRETLPEDAAKTIEKMSEGMKVRYTVGDTAMFAEHSGPSIAEEFAKAGLSMIDADKQRVPGWVQVHTWLRDVMNDGVSVRPRLQFWREGVPHCIRTLPAQTVDPKDPHDIVTTGVEDDAADALRYFVMSRPGRSREPKPKPEMAWIFKEIAKIKRRTEGNFV